MGRLEDKIALVTGGARGQGEAAVRAFVAEGARVVIADVLDEEGEKLAADLGDAAVFQHLDVGDEDAWTAAVERVQAEGQDGRFEDPAWTLHPVYRRWAQSYLTWTGVLERMAEAPRPGDDWRRAERARFAAKLLADATAPTNVLGGNPAALKHAFDTGGASLVRGARNAARDLARNRVRERFAIFEDAIAGDPWILASGFSAADLYAANLTRWSAGTEWRERHAPKIQRLADAVAARPDIAHIWKKHFGDRR